jgi:hypothetical protein
MSTGIKVLTGTLLGAGLIVTVGYVKKLKKTQTELQIIPTADLHQLTWNAITIKVNVLLKNPTKGSFAIRYPFVKIDYKGNTLGSSQAVAKQIKIPAYGEAIIDNIMVVIPVVSFFSVTSEVLKTLQAKKPVQMTLSIMSEIDLGWIKVPYVSKENISVSK